MTLTHSEQALIDWDDSAPSDEDYDAWEAKRTARAVLLVRMISLAKAKSLDKKDPFAALT